MLRPSNKNDRIIFAPSSRHAMRTPVAAGPQPSATARCQTARTPRPPSSTALPGRPHQSAYFSFQITRISSSVRWSSTARLRSASSQQPRPHISRSNPAYGLRRRNLDAAWERRSSRHRGLPLRSSGFFARHMPQRISLIEGPAPKKQGPDGGTGRDKNLGQVRLWAVRQLMRCPIALR